MEMHQIRYFLGVARTLNFTRAAEDCNVSQPSLTRAIKLLEEEFGGELFRRERNHSHLTELGERMRPLMQQCYETAQGAKSLATAIKRGEVATLKVALSRTIDMALLIPFLTELMRAMNGLELKFLRGTGSDVAEFMKQGQADLAISGPLPEAWDRLDAWPLFTEGISLVVNAQHRLAQRDKAELGDLRQERLLMRTYCEQADQLAALLRSHDIGGSQTHEVASERDLMSLLDANMGVAIAPRSLVLTGNLKRVAMSDLDMPRTVHLYAVAGRQRSGPATTLMKQLQAADWEKILA
jgi:DNA-binding transcriptional LysR family regulator